MSRLRAATYCFEEIEFSGELWTQQTVHWNILECVIGGRDEMLNGIKEYEPCGLSDTKIFELHDRSQGTMLDITAGVCYA